MWRILFVCWTLSAISPTTAVIGDSECVDGQVVFPPERAFVFGVRGLDDAVVQLRLTQNEPVKWQAFASIWRCGDYGVGIASHSIPTAQMFAFLLEHYGWPSSAFERLTITTSIALEVQDIVAKMRATPQPPAPPQRRFFANSIREASRAPPPMCTWGHSERFDVTCAADFACRRWTTPPVLASTPAPSQPEPPSRVNAASIALFIICYAITFCLLY